MTPRKNDSSNAHKLALETFPGSVFVPASGLSFVGARGAGPKSAVVKKKIMRLRIEAHRLCSKLGCNSLHFRDLLGRILMKNMDLALDGRDVRQACFSFKDISVDPAANRQRLENLAVVLIHHDQKWRTATRSAASPRVAVRRRSTAWPASGAALRRNPSCLRVWSDALSGRRALRSIYKSYLLD
jgi:hypothetical protein